MRRIHGDHVLGDPELLPVSLDLFADIVTFRLERQRRERPADRDGGREVFLVAENLDGLPVPRDGHDSVVRLPEHRVTERRQPRYS